MGGSMMEEPSAWPDDGIILYDGVCVLCSGWVRFVMRRDVARRFRFTPIQSPYGCRLAQTLGIDPAAPVTNAVILAGHALRRSDATLAVLSRLPNWGWVNVLHVVPRGMRDFVYDLIARNRYRIFGRHDACDLSQMPPTDRIILEAMPLGK
jgi:predicted DCC family thiol-disulfide oxidoreductase YuxK